MGEISRQRVSDVAHCILDSYLLGYSPGVGAHFRVTNIIIRHRNDAAVGPVPILRTAEGRLKTLLFEIRKFASGRRGGDLQSKDTCEQDGSEHGELHHEDVSSWTKLGGERRSCVRARRPHYITFEPDRNTTDLTVLTEWFVGCFRYGCMKWGVARSIQDSLTGSQKSDSPPRTRPACFCYFIWCDTTSERRDEAIRVFREI